MSSPSLSSEMISTLDSVAPGGESLRAVGATGGGASRALTRVAHQGRDGLRGGRQGEGQDGEDGERRRPRMAAQRSHLLVVEQPARGPCGRERRVRAQERAPVGRGRRRTILVDGRPPAPRFRPGGDAARF